MKYIITNDQAALVAHIHVIKRVMGFVHARVSLFFKRNGLPVDGEQRKKYIWTLDQWEDIKNQ